MVKFGFTAPILVDDPGVILAGEARWQVAQDLKLETVPKLRSGPLPWPHRKADSRACRVRHVVDTDSHHPHRDTARNSVTLKKVDSARLIAQEQGLTPKSNS